MEIPAAQCREEYGLPASGQWFYKQEHAFSAGGDCSESSFMAWDKASDGSKFYGVFPTCRAMWEAIEQHTPETSRYGYEIIHEGAVCKAFVDMEWLCPAVTAEQEAEARGDTLVLMREYIQCIKSGAKSQFGSVLVGEPRVTVLDGTRRVSIKESKAKDEEVYDAWLQNGGSGVTIECLKFSYHIILLDIAFEHISQVKGFVCSLPKFSSLGSGCNAAVKWRPHNFRNAPDLGVYTKNRVFRMRLCSKRDTSTQLQFCKELTDSLDEMDCMVTFTEGLSALPNAAAAASAAAAAAAASSLPVNGPGRAARKRPAAAAVEDDTISSSSSGSKTKRPMTDSESAKQRLQALKVVCQTVLQEYGDAHTLVKGLHKVDERNLWFECRNKGQRVCLLGNVTHMQNQFFLWLEPPIRVLFSADSSHGGEVEDTYEVKYQCPSRECGSAIGTIAKLQWDSRLNKYAHTLQFPPMLQSSMKRPAGFCARREPLPGSVFSAGGSQARIIRPPQAPAVAPAVASALTSAEAPAMTPAMATAMTPAVAPAMTPAMATAEAPAMAFAEAATVMATASASAEAMMTDSADSESEELELEDVNLRLTKKKAEVEKMVSGLQIYREEVCTVLVSISNGLEVDLSELWLQFSLYFGYYKADTQLAIWDRASRVAWPAERLQAALAELRRMHAEDNPDPNDKAALTYEHVLKVLEHRYGLCFFNGQAVYARRQRSKQDHCMEKRLTYLNKEKLTALLASHFYYEMSPSEDGVLQYKRFRFIDRWISDPNKEQWENADVDPSERILSRFTYNLWSGFDVEKIRRVAYSSEPNEEEQQQQPRLQLGDLSTLIRSHIFEVIANEDQTIYEFIMDYFAHLLYKPHQRTDVLWFIFGEQGAGKSFITDLLRGLMGEQSYIESNKPEHELFSKHGHGWLSKIVVHIEEAKELKKYHSNLKNLVTAKYLEYEEKFQSTKTAINYTNLIITANSMNAIFVPHDDRRCFAIRASSRYIQNGEYFDRLYATVKDKRVLRDFYDYCGTRDLSRYRNGMQSFVPKTDFFNECIIINLHPFYRFLSAFVDRELLLMLNAQAQSQSQGSSGLEEATTTATATARAYIKTIMAKVFANELNEYEMFNHVEPTPAMKITQKLRSLVGCYDTVKANDDDDDDSGRRGPDENAKKSKEKNSRDEGRAFVLGHTGGCSRYTFDLQKLKECMIAKKLYDAEATI